MWRLVGCWTHEVRAILGCPAVPRCLRRAWRNLRPMSSRPESQVAKGDWSFNVFVFCRANMAKISGSVKTPPFLMLE